MANPDLPAEWKSEEQTQIYVREIKDHVRRAFTDLLGAAKESTDPKVREAVTKWDVYGHILERLVGSKPGVPK